MLLRPLTFIWKILRLGVVSVNVFAKSKIDLQYLFVPSAGGNLFVALEMFLLACVEVVAFNVFGGAAILALMLFDG